jgi:Acetyltransferase (GNAT) domain
MISQATRLQDAPDLTRPGRTASASEESTDGPRSLEYMADWPFEDTVEVGYVLGSEFWGHGYATEAARASIRHGFEVIGLGRIISTTCADPLGLAQSDGEVRDDVPRDRPLAGRRHRMLRGRPAVRCSMSLPDRGGVDQRRGAYGIPAVRQLGHGPLLVWAPGGPVRRSEYPRRSWKPDLCAAI